MKFRTILLIWVITLAFYDHCAEAQKNNGNGNNGNNGNGNNANNVGNNNGGKVEDDDKNKPPAANNNNNSGTTNTAATKNTTKKPTNTKKPLTKLRVIMSGFNYNIKRRVIRRPPVRKQNTNQNKKFYKVILPIRNVRRPFYNVIRV